MRPFFDPNNPVTFFKNASHRRAKAAILHILGIMGITTPEALRAVQLTADLLKFREHFRPIYGETWISLGDSFLPHPQLGHIAAGELRTDKAVSISHVPLTIAITDHGMSLRKELIGYLSPADLERLEEAIGILKRDSFDTVTKRLHETPFVLSASAGQALDWRKALPGLDPDDEIDALIEAAENGTFTF